jgi:hypothetical protein
VGQLDGVEGLGEGADLVDLDEDAVGGALVQAPLDALDVGDEQVVPDQLELVVEGLGEGGPACPVVLGQAVLDGDEGVLESRLRPSPASS